MTQNKRVPQMQQQNQGNQENQNNHQQNQQQLEKQKKKNYCTSVFMLVIFFIVSNFIVLQFYLNYMMPEEGNGHYLKSLFGSNIGLYFRCPSNCKKCDDGISCSTCYQNYEWKPEKLICEKQSEQQSGQELEPQETFEGKCIGYQCQLCEQSLNKTQDQQVCRQCNRSNLYEFQDNCYQQCPEGSFRIEGKFECQQCQVDNCKVCNQQNKCSECKIGYEKLFNKETQEYNCVMQCKEGEYKSLKSNKCEKCQTQNCNICKQENEGKECQQCEGELILHENKCLETCPQSTYLDKNQNSCKKCSDNCEQCDNSQICNQCEQNFQMYKNQCYLECPLGTFKNNQNRLCEECSQQSCEVCDEGIDNCTKCKETYFLKQDSQQCVQECPESYYPNKITRQCYKCQIQNCTECSQQDICEKCSNDLYLYQNECLENCPQGTYPDDIYNKCQKCKGENCQECDKQGDCIQCDPQYFRNQNTGFCLNFQQCLEQMGHPNTDTYICESCTSPNCENCENDKNICEKCQKNYKLDNGVCVSGCPQKQFYDDKLQKCQNCIENCQSCFDGSSCQVCQQNYLLVVDTKICVQSCNEGYYKNQYENLCELCIDNCINCQDDKNKCKKCSDNYILHQNKCVLECPQGYFHAKSTNKCVKCSQNCGQCENFEVCQKCEENYFLLDNVKCVNSKGCGFGKFANAQNQTCSSCSKFCIQCANKNECLKCEHEMILYEDGCIQVCPEKTYLDEYSHQCMPCVDNCIDCDDSHNCDKCIDNYYLFNNSQCVQECPQSTYKDSISFICENCQENCNSCIDSTSCQECEKNYFLKQNQDGSLICVSHDNCGESQYADLKTNKCQNCIENCQACSDYEHCTKCVDSYFLQKDTQDECVKAEYCSDKTYPDVQSGKCENCVKNCERCEDFIICLQCSEDYILSDDKSQCIKISNCGDHCIDCQDETNKCLKCDIDYFLHNDRCNINCPLKYYKNVELQTCEQCMENCDQCQNSSSCDVCDSQYIFDSQKNQCVQRCQDGQYFHINNNKQGQCKNCYTGCKKCKEYGYCTECSNSDHHLLDHMTLGGNLIKKCFECPEDYCYDNLSQKCYKSYECPRSKDNKKQVCTKQNRYCVEMGLDGDGMPPIHFHLKNIDNLFTQFSTFQQNNYNTSQSNETQPQQLQYQQVKKKICANLQQDSHQAFVELFDQEFKCTFSHIDFDKYDKTIKPKTQSKVLNRHVNTYTWLILLEISDGLLEQGYNLDDIPMVLEKSILTHQNENNIFRSPKSVYYVFLAQSKIFNYYQNNIKQGVNYDYFIIEKYQNIALQLKRESYYQSINPLQQMIFINSPDENNQIVRTKNGIIYTFTFWMNELRFQSETYEFNY